MSTALESAAAPRLGRLSHSPVAFEYTGPPHAPAVAVLGGISASRHVAANDTDRTPGWWQTAVGPGLAIDTLRYRVLSIDYVTEGTTPGSPGRTADQAAALAAALDLIGIERLHAVVGASYGGMVALAFGAASPHRVGRLLVISAAHESHPLATASRLLQRRVVELGLASGRGAEALAIARGIAMSGYGTPAEFHQRFRVAGDDDVAATCRRIGEHLSAAGDRFARSCSPARFLALSSSLDLHRVRPEDVRVPATIVAVHGDQVVPVEQARELAARLGAPCRLLELESIYGHDAFLNEPALFAPILTGVLDASTGISA